MRSRLDRLLSNRRLRLLNRGVGWLACEPAFEADGVRIFAVTDE